MRVFLQLLREFWLPLLLGALWTAFNVVDRPNEDWSVRTVLNVFGPTFFFMSWLVAQWYRVRKQQRVEEGINSLHAGVHAIQSPLLPCGLFLSLRFEADDEDLGRVFREQRGYRAYGPDTAVPPPPVGPPPGTENCRLFSQMGYVDYRGGVVTAAGLVRLSHPHYNVLHRDVVHTIADFDPKACSKQRSPNEPLFCQPFVTLEIYPAGKPKTGKTTPALVLKSNPGTPSVVVGASALDNTVVVDHMVKSLAVSPPDATGYSSSSLKHAFLRLTIDFFFIEGVSSLPKSSWPRLHNLQLWPGGTGRQLLTFREEDLSTQIAGENPKPIARGAAAMPQITFEYQIHPEVFMERFQSVA